METRGFTGSIEASDAMVKAASVGLVKQIPIGGGLLTVLVKGDVGSVKAAVEAGSGSGRPGGRTGSFARFGASARRPAQSILVNKPYEEEIEKWQSKH